MKDDRLDLFINMTNERLKTIESKLDMVLSSQFKFKGIYIGASVVISCLTTIALSLLGFWLHK